MRCLTKNGNPLQIDNCGLRQILKNGSIFDTVAGIQTFYTPNESLQLFVSAHISKVLYTLQLLEM